MTQSLVMTAIGQDRPGLVKSLTEVLLTANLNIEDSRMSILGGEFAIILLVSGPEVALNKIIDNQPMLEQQLELSLLIKPTSGRTDIVDASQTYQIKVEGMDNPGIVHKLTAYLSQQGANITSLHTRTGHAPHTGSPVYTVEMQITIPAGVNVDQIEEGFSKTCNELNMDVEFSPA